MQPLAALAVTLALTGQAAAQPAVTTPDGMAQVRLVDGWRQADGSRIAAVAITLAPGWHTYWRVPGEAGIPPQFDWTGSGNLASVAYQWPRPSVIDSYGIRSIGYAGTVTLPVVLGPAERDQPIDLALRLTFGACAQICTQEDVVLSARLPAAAPRSAADPEAVARIDAALADRPRTPREAGVEQVTCSLAAGADGYEITTRVTFANRPDSDQVAVIETAPEAGWIGPPDSETIGRTVTSRAPVAASAGAAGPLFDRRDVRVTLLDSRRAVDIRGCAAPG